MKFVFEQLMEATDITTEDNGRAKVAHIAVSDDVDEDSEEGLFVRIQSWSWRKEHPDFDKLPGKRVRVTVETIEDPSDDSEVR